MDAERWLAGVEVAKTRGEWTDPRLARVTVGAWSARWLAAQVQLKPSTRATYETLLRHQVLPTWENVPLAKVAHADVAAWVAGLTASGLSASRTRQAFRVLSLMLDLAVRDGRIARNAAAGVKLPRPRVREKRFLTHAQVGALADACGRYRTFVLVLAYCGLRCGEAAALRVRCLDLLRGRIEVAESVTEVDGRLVYGTPKTHERRSVPVPRSLRDELAAACEGKRADDFVFTSPEGAPLRERNFRRRYFDRAASGGGAGRTRPARAALHRREPGRAGRRDGQGRAADARAQERGHDPRRVRSVVGGRAGRRRRPARRGGQDRSCDGLETA